MKQYFFSLTLFTIALLVSGSLFAQTDCDPTGNGNPDATFPGQGQGTGDTDGSLAWGQLLNANCDNSGEPSFNLLKDYDPGDICQNSSLIIPEYGRSTVRVAIIDSGVLPTKPNLFNDIKLFSHIVDSNGIVTNGIAHPHPHGTYSAGVIAGLLLNNPILVTDDYEFYDYQVLDEDLHTSLAAVVAAIDHAVDQDVNVISLSIGFQPLACDNIDWENPASPLYAALQRARDLGVVVVTSAGNDANNLSVAPQYPAAYSDLDNVVSVGALACDAAVPAEFSNFSDKVVDVFTTGAFVQVYFNGCFHSINGTSFATSIVAGKAAIHFTDVHSANEVLSLLRSQTIPFPGREQFSIYGIVSVEKSRKSFDSSGNSGENLQTPTAAPEVFTTSPNPFRDQLRMDLGNLEGTATISLLDTHGRRLLSREVTQPVFSLELGHLPQGVYWLNVRTATGTQTRTIVKK